MRSRAWAALGTVRLPPVPVTVTSGSTTAGATGAISACAPLGAVRTGQPAAPAAKGASNPWEVLFRFEGEAILPEFPVAWRKCDNLSQAGRMHLSALRGAAPALPVRSQRRALAGHDESPLEP